MARQWLGKSYTVTYNSSNPLSILTQKLGSVWPTILPYCILNTLLMAILHVLLAHGIDLDISEQGHTFMSLVVSFLLVSRVSMAVGRYYEARDFLETMNKSFLQLVFTVCIYSNRDGSLSAKEWRNEVAYAALILVRTAMAVLDFPSSGVKVMNIPEVNGAILQDLESSLPPTRWLHEARTEYEENFRIPIRLSYLLRESIRSQEGRVEPAIPAVAEGDLYAFVNGGMDGYFGLHKFVTTPVPFPLLQMSSTFLWFYIFTVPFALLSADDVGIKSALSHCLMIFIMTFGFIGMEHVAVQMDDPFGGDDNDFNNLAMAHVAFEDAYLAVERVDGVEWANKLRSRLNYQDVSGQHPDEYSCLLSKV